MELDILYKPVVTDDPCLWERRKGRCLQKQAKIGGKKKNQLSHPPSEDFTLDFNEFLSYILPWTLIQEPDVGSGGTGSSSTLVSSGSMLLKLIVFTLLSTSELFIL